MSEINEVKEPTAEVNEIPSSEELIKRYAEVQQISIEQAQSEVGAETAEEILKNIEEKTLTKIREKMPVLNRAQRRALKKKYGAKKYAEMMGDSGGVVETVTETAKKLNYIDLIQKLRKLNEKKENEENGETITEDN